MKIIFFMRRKGIKRGSQFINKTLVEICNKERSNIIIYKCHNNAK